MRLGKAAVFLSCGVTGLIFGAAGPGPGSRATLENLRAQAQVEGPSRDRQLRNGSELPAAGDVISLPGEFAIQPMHGGIYTGYYLTAVDGGGRTEDAIHSDAKQVGSWEKFRLLVDTATGHYGVQTDTGNYVTAVGGGGRVADVIHTDATQLRAWEKFRLPASPHDYPGTENLYAIQTFDGHYLTAVGGGGKTTDAIHSDAVSVRTWEEFWIWKCGDLGSKYRYSIWNPLNGYFFAANGGGGRIKSVLTYLGPNVTKEWGGFTLLRQDDGAYAIRTASGNYLTAVGGGGQASGTADSDNLHTDATWVRAWEKFRIVEVGSCTYAIQTVSGFYLGPGTGPPGAEGISTRISDIGAATRFRFTMMDLSALP